jgi:hypothetical protein
MLILVTFFFATAAIGWWREKRDVQTIRSMLAQRELQIRSAITKVGNGVPINEFKELFPNAYFIERDREWAVKIPVGYKESPTSTSADSVTKYFKLDGDIVKPVQFKSAIGFSHGDRFGLGGVWYYFGRAWYSTAD